MLIDSARRAFSLAEILVALAILAIMSAVVVPTIGGLLQSSDGSRIAADLTAIQAAVKAFASDVHRYPGTVTELSTIIDATSQDINASSVPANLAAKWQGPYMVRDVTQSLRTVGLNPSFVRVTGDNAVSYLSIRLTSVAPTDFAVIESILDAGTATSTSATAGVVRYSGTVLTFLAVPLI